VDEAEHGPGHDVVAGELEGGTDVDLLAVGRHDRGPGHHDQQDALDDAAEQSQPDAQEVEPEADVGGRATGDDDGGHHEQGDGHGEVDQQGQDPLADVLGELPPGVAQGVADTGAAGADGPAGRL